MDAILTKIHLGITFCEPCVVSNTYYVIGYRVCGKMRYCRILSPRTQVMAYEVGWVAEDFIAYYKYLYEAKIRDNRSI